MDAVRKAAEDDPRERPPPEETTAVDDADAGEPTGQLVLLSQDRCRIRTILLPGFEPGPTEPGCSAEQTSPRPDGASLIARDELERAARRHPNVPDPPVAVDVDVADVVWLSRTRAVLRLDVSVRGRLARLGPQPLIAFFASGRLVHTASFFRHVGRLRASPDGGYVAVPPGIVLRRDGSEASLPPQLVHAHAVAWSPDGRWLALAQRAEIVLVDVQSLERHDRTAGGLRTVSVSAYAAELVWR